jgi:hypothetical protein
MTRNRRLPAAALAAALLTTPASAWIDTVFPDPRDPSENMNVRIGDSSWVNLFQFHSCEPGWVGDKCPVPVPDLGAISSKANLADPRGYNLPSIVIRCEALPGAPVKYSLRVFDNAWFLDNDGQNIKVPNDIGLSIDGRDVLNLDTDGDPGFANEFEAKISKDQLIESARPSKSFTKHRKARLAWPSRLLARP